MKQVFTIYILLALALTTKAYITNPFTNTYQSSPQTVSLSLKDSLPNYTSSNTVRASTVVSSTQTTMAPAPAPATATAPAPASGQYSHTHAYPAAAPAPVAAPVAAPVYRPAPVATPTYAPAPVYAHAPHRPTPPAQNLTYQQIIEFLVNSNGSNLSSLLSGGSGTYLNQCKNYCDSLPPSPVCDTDNVLYRNECEAKCVQKTVSTSTLRYGMCCCSDADFNYDVTQNVYISSVPTSNFCVSKCIFNCLGGEAPIIAEHTSDPAPLQVGLSGDKCNPVN